MVSTPVSTGPPSSAQVAPSAQVASPSTGAPADAPRVPALPLAQDRLDALTALVLEVSSQRNVEDTLDVALRQCLSLTASEFGFIGLVRPPEHELGVGELEIVAIHGFHPAPHFFADNRVIPLRPNIFNTVVLENRAVRTADAANDPDRVGQPKGHPAVGAFLGVPLRLDGAPIGMIGLANRAGPYEDEHERLTLTYASLIAVLIHNAQLYEQLQQTNEWLERLVGERTSELAQARDALAEKASRLQAVLADTVDTQENERRRISADLHDGINQLLIGAMLELTSSRHRIDAGQPDAAAASLDSARDILADVEAEIRRVVHDLHPPVLEGLGLTAGLREVADRFETYSGIACSVEVTGRPVRLGDRAEASLYRLVQEALKNVAVHAAAGHATVGLVFDADEACLTVSVTDDGRGFVVADADRAGTAGGRYHLGLESMRRRVESLAGRWEIGSTPGGGTTVRASVPLTASPTWPWTDA
jgi:signal transduction histidine kinase